MTGSDSTAALAPGDPGQRVEHPNAGDGRASQVAVRERRVGAGRSRPARSRARSARWLPWTVLVVLPLVSGVAAVRGGWTPVSDWAMIAAGSSETLSRDPMLVGQPTSLGVVAGDSIAHPGPLLYWLLGLPVGLLGPPGQGVVVGAVLVNIASLVALGVLLGGFRQPLILLAGAVGAVLLVGEMDHSFLRNPFNPAMAVLPTVVTAIALACVLAGHPKTMVVLVVSGSFAAQTHVSAVPVIGLVVGAAVVALVWSGWWGRSRSVRRVARRWLAVSGAVGIACWIGPIIDQVAGEGNLWALVTGSRADQVLGPVAALRRAVMALAGSPLWGDPQRPRLTNGAIDQQEIGAVHLWEVAVAVCLLGGLALLVTRGVHRHNAPLAAFGGTSLVMVGGVTLMTSQLPATSGLLPRAAAPANNHAWAVAVVLVWTTIAAGLAHVVATEVPAVRAGVRRIHRRRWLAAATGAAALTVIAIGGGAVTPLDPSGDRGSILWGPARVHAAAIDDAVPSGTPVVLEVEAGADPAFMVVVPTLIGQLQVRGIDAYYRAARPEAWVPGLIPRYEVTTVPPGAARVVVRVGPHALDEVAGYTRLSDYDPANPPPRYRGDTALLLGHGRQPTSVDLAPTAQTTPTT
jgi:hypothetical protein